MYSFLELPCFSIHFTIQCFFHIKDLAINWPIVQSKMIYWWSTNSHRHGNLLLIGWSLVSEVTSPVSRRFCTSWCWTVRSLGCCSAKASSWCLWRTGWTPWRSGSTTKAHPCSDPDSHSTLYLSVVANELQSEF